MSVKISKNDLKGLINKILTERVKKNKPVQEQSRTDAADRVAGRDTGGRRLDEEDEDFETDGDTPGSIPDAVSDTIVSSVLAALQGLSSGDRSAVISAISNPVEPQQAGPVPADAPGDVVSGEASADGQEDDDKDEPSPAGPQVVPEGDKGTEDLKETAHVGTPEKESMIYENRFGKRNADLFEKLKTKWAK